MNSSIQPLQGISFCRKIDEIGGDGNEFAKSSIVRGLTAIESLIDEKNSENLKFCVGDELTVADLYLGPQVENAVSRFRVDISQFPKISKIVTNLDENFVEIRNAKPLFQKDTPNELPDFLK